MIRSAPPAPFKTALITLLIAIAIAVMAAGKADARVAGSAYPAHSAPELASP